MRRGLSELDVWNEHRGWTTPMKIKWVESSESPEIIREGRGRVTHLKHARKRPVRGLGGRTLGKVEVRGCGVSVKRGEMERCGA